VPGPPRSWAFTTEGSTVRAGAEWTFRRGGRTYSLRAGGRWGEYSVFNVGFGFELSRRWRVETALLGRDALRQGVLAASLEPRR
jgi:hypothetical protein